MMKNTKIDYVRWIPLITIILLFIFLSLIDPDFASLYNIKSLLTQASTLIILACGITFIILIGGIDLSNGAVVSCSSVIVAVLLPSMGYFAFVVALLFGLGAGFFNGIVVSKGKVPSFIVTLGSYGIWLSMAYVISGGRPVGIPDSLIKYTNWTTGEILGIPNAIIITLVIILSAIFLLRKTNFGRYLYAIGNGEKTTILSGINVQKVRLKVFMLGGLLSSVGGILLLGRLASGTPSVGESYNLPSIASVIVGGTALTGGFGGISRTVVGALIITLINNGMNVIGVDAFAQQIVLGAILIFSVALNLDRDKIPVLK